MTEVVATRRSMTILACRMSEVAAEDLTLFHNFVTDWGSWYHETFTTDCSLGLTATCFDRETVERPQLFTYQGLKETFHLPLSEDYFEIFRNSLRNEIRNWTLNLSELTREWDWKYRIILFTFIFFHAEYIFVVIYYWLQVTTHQILVN